MAVCLKIIAGIGSGQTLSVPNDQPITLGRSSQASYAFDDPLLSRKHCAVECRGNASRVVDLQSRNGTYVNGQRIAAPQLLRPGDRIKIGSIVMEVTPVQGQPTTPAAAQGPTQQYGTVLMNQVLPLPQGASAPLPVATAPPPPPPPYAPVPAPMAMAAGGPSVRPGGMPGPMDFGATLAAPADVVNPLLTACEACRAPLKPGEARPFRGRVVCPRCLDRYDVDEDLIEGFKILERIASTSTGTVYKAKQLLMGRLVTLKTLMTTGQSDEKALRRFMREAKAGGRLSHASIVELYDVNEQGDLMYIVMEYIEGETLEAMLKARGPLPLPTALRYMGQVGDALRYAHEQQIIHRDIRPATILVRKEDDRAKITDFTLAKNLERAAFSVITADGEAIGTPYYMPPEQVKSAKAADQRSDLYSYAATFYHVLSGRLPIEARSYGEFITRVFATDPTPLDKLNPQIPAKLAQVFQKAMLRDPAARYQDMEALANDLANVQRALGITV